MAPLSMLGLLILVSLCSNAVAEHAWGKLHWERTSNPFQVTVVSSMRNKYWDDRLRKVNGDWNQAAVFDGSIQTEYGTWTPKERKACDPIEGKVRACNDNHGPIEWAGLASVWFVGDHIVQCTAEVNDYYMTTESDKLHVLCHEIGHCWGLGHQSVDGSDLDTCMDYADARDNETPDDHDLAMLDTIYAHQDTKNSAINRHRKLMGSGPEPKESKQGTATTVDTSRFGKLVKEDEREAYWEKELPDGTRVVTHALKVRALHKKPTAKAAKPVLGVTVSTASS